MKNKKCQCACHDNRLEKSYEHETKCCDDMNGFVANNKTNIEHIEKEFNDEFSILPKKAGECLVEASKIKLFYRQKITELVRERLKTPEIELPVKTSYERGKRDGYYQAFSEILSAFKEVGVEI